MFDLRKFYERDSKLNSEKRNKFNRLKNVCYLDNAGASLYSEAQVEEYARLLCGSVYGNPHSGNQSSSLSTDTIDQVRQRVAQFFNTSLDEYSVIFTSGCTASLKLLADSFRFQGTHCSQCYQQNSKCKNAETFSNSKTKSDVQKEDVEDEADIKTEAGDQLSAIHNEGKSSEAEGFGPGHVDIEADTGDVAGELKAGCGMFCYTEDNHTSVIGMREVVKQRGYRYHCILQKNIERLFTENISNGRNMKIVEKSDALTDCDSGKAGKSVNVESVSNEMMSNKYSEVPLELNSLASSEVNNTQGADEVCKLKNWYHKKDIDTEEISSDKNMGDTIEKQDSEASVKCHCCHGNSLFVYPAQSNFNGRKYPLSWVEKVLKYGINILDETSECREFSRKIPSPSPFEGQGHRKWFVGLDAASFVSTSPLNLDNVKPDFVTLSFYKIFGFPTGLGALLVRNSSADILEKTYFGGGSVDVSISGEDFHVPRKHISERFEDGTVSFLDIIALNCGFDSLQQIAGSMADISLHTFHLARFVYKEMLLMTHHNGAPVVNLYHGSHFDDITEQGPIICFNVLRMDGSHVGFSQVDKCAQAGDLHLRTGCFCNMGACQHHLCLSSETIRNNHQAGHVCGDDIDLINGQPTGACRISFGYYSTLQDALIFLNFLHNCFAESPTEVDYLVQGQDRLREHYEKRGKLPKINIEKFEETSKVTNCGGKGKGELGGERKQLKNCEILPQTLLDENIKDIETNGIVNKSVNAEKSGEKVTKESRDMCSVDKEMGVLLGDIDERTGPKYSQSEALVESQSNSNTDSQSNRNTDTQSKTNMDSVANGNQAERVLTNIFLYPVKSCGAFEVSAWELGPRGLLYDREWMVTTETGVCLSQKRETRLCLIRPRLDLERGKLRLTAEGHPDLELNLDQRSEETVQGRICQSKVCGDRVSASDCGLAVSQWLQDVLGRPRLRLVRQSETDTRSHQTSQLTRGAANLSLANEAQFLLINRTSCRAAMDTMSQSESLDETLGRFRANLVVNTATEFEEDQWKEICIGSQRFVKQRQCTRCQMITVNQRTGEKCKEPLVQLARTRHRKMQFGILLYQGESVFTGRRVIQVGDKLQVCSED